MAWWFFSLFLFLFTLSIVNRVWFLVCYIAFLVAFLLGNRIFFSQPLWIAKDKIYYCLGNWGSNVEDTDDISLNDFCF